MNQKKGTLTALESMNVCKKILRNKILGKCTIWLSLSIPHRLSLSIPHRLSLSIPHRLSLSIPHRLSLSTPQSVQAIDRGNKTLKFDEKRAQEVPPRVLW